MRRVVISALLICLFTGACLPAPATDIPAPTVDLEGTAAVFVQQTLEAVPSATLLPSNTPVVVSETSTSTATPTVSTVAVETATPNAVSTTGTTTVVPTIGTSASLTTTATQSTIAATETLHARFYGTLPPQVAHNSLELVNKSKAEAYISLQVTVADGSTTVIEYPVGGLFSIQAPVGRYKYVAWVGGNKIVGSFTLSSGNGVRLTIYKDRIEVRKR